MTHPTCSQLRAQLKEIKELKTEFDFELAKITNTRDTSLVLGLEKELKEKTESVMESLFQVDQNYKLHTAEKIFGKDFLGPDAIETAFGFKPETKDIPVLPFSRADLVRAKELGQFLVLRVEKTPDGQPLTMKNMNELKEGKTKDGEKILKSGDWYENEQFFTVEAPSLGWALASKGCIPSSSIEYTGQTETLINYLQTEVLNGQELDEVYHTAVSEFYKVRGEIGGVTTTVDDYVKEWAKKLSNLKINNLLRPTPVEILYDTLLMKEYNGEYTFLDDHTMTNRLSNDGYLVHMWRETQFEGLELGYSLSNNNFGPTGAAFSRRR